jgi:hypothetical protein
MRTETVTIRGQVREVEVEFTGTWWRSVGRVTLYQKNGGKLWKDHLYFRQEKDGTLTPLFHNTFLNRPGYRAVGWDDEGFAKNRSNHNSLGQGAGA